MLKAFALLVIGCAVAVTSSPAQMFGIGSGFLGSGWTLYRVDAFDTAPSRVDIASIGKQLTDMAIVPNGTAYAIDATGNLYQMNLLTGAIVSMFTIPAFQNSLDAANDFTLYSWGFIDQTVYRIDLLTATFAPVVNTGFQASGDLALDPNGVDLFGAAFANHLIRINLNTLVVTDIGIMFVAPGLVVPGLDFDASGQLYATSGNSGTGATEVFAVDKTTAGTTLIGDISGAGNYGMSINATAVAPEPATLLLLAPGLAVVGALRRRRGLRRDEEAY